MSRTYYGYKLKSMNNNKELLLKMLDNKGKT